MKRLFYILLTIMLFFTVAKHEACAFSIEPARIELSIPAGKQKGKAITIDNSMSDEPLHLKIYMQDVVFLPDGTNDFPPAASTVYSCANWVKIIPEEIDMPAGKTQNIRISVSVPAQAKGGYYGMLFFESSAGTAQGLNINFRIGGLVDITVTNTEERSAKIGNIALNTPKQIDIDIFNEGNVLLRPKGKIKIFDTRGKRIKQIDFNLQSWGVLPKSMRKFHTELDRPLSQGQYTIKAEIDYGTRYLLVAELPVRVD
jgi:hypothetical protein